MVFYYLMLSFSTALLYVCRKVEEQQVKRNSDLICAKLIGISVVIVLALIAGFRDGLGTDYFSYVEIFDKLTWHTDLEFGFVAVNMIIKSIVDYTPLMFTICALIMYMPIYLSSKKYSNYSELSFFLFVTFGFYANSFNIMRQYMAAGIIIFSFQYVFKKKFFPYLIGVVIAYLFHKSALIMLPLYPIFTYEGKYVEWLRVFIILIAFLLVLYVKDIFAILYDILPKDFKYTKYLNPDNIVWGTGRGLTFPLFAFITYVLYRFAKMKHGKLSRVIEVQMNIVIVGFLFSYIGQRLEMVLRLQIYTVIMMTFLIPNLLSLFKGKRMLYLMVLIMGVIYFTYITIDQPYKSILIGELL